MPFLSPLQLRYIGTGRYETTAPLTYRGERDTITVPAGFSTDLASVPRLFWGLLPPTGIYERAATFHDFGCVSLTDGSCLLSSRDVDGLFRRQVREDGTGLVKRWLLWWGVRLGALGRRARRAGWLHWKDTPIFVAITVPLLAVAGGTAAAVVLGVLDLAGLR